MPDAGEPQAQVLFVPLADQFPLEDSNPSK